MGTLVDIYQPNFPQISGIPNKIIMKSQSTPKQQLNRCVCQKSEDKTLRIAVTKYKIKSWVAIAELVNKANEIPINAKTAKQCRERWVNHLDPEINTNPISINESIRKQCVKENRRWRKIRTLIKIHQRNKNKPCVFYIYNNIRQS